MKLTVSFLLIAALAQAGCGGAKSRHLSYAAVKSCFEKTDGVVRPSGRSSLTIAYANVTDDAAAILLIGVAENAAASRRAIEDVLVPRGLTLDWRREQGNLAAALLSRVEPHGDPGKLPAMRSHAEKMYDRCVT